MLDDDKNRLLNNEMYQQVLSLIKDKSERKKVEDLTLDIYAKLLEALSNGGIVQK